MKKIAIIINCLLLMTSYHVQAADFETAKEAVKNMGVGWNLGNTLEAHSQSVTDVTQDSFWGQQDLTSESCWGQYATKPELLKMMKDAGFGAIRVPVTWYNHMDKDGKVDAAWMARVHEVVDYVINQGMYCIINVHHDTGADSKDDNGNLKGYHWIKADEANYTSNKSRFESLWKQIAEEFKDYDQKLLFEGYNEMLDKISSWCFASYSAPGNYDATIAKSAYNAINSYAQSFVDAVRATGGNNVQRNLIVTTYASCCGSGAWNAHLQDPLKEMKMPTGESNHIIFEVHDYPDIANLSNAKKELDGMISSLNTHLVAKGAPVIIGEWGTSNVDQGEGKTDYDVRKADMFEFVDYFVKQAKSNNIATFYWMGLTDGASRLFPAFNQDDLALKILQAYHGTSHNPTLPTRADYSDVCISGTVNYTQQWAEFSLFKGSVNAYDYSGIELELESAPAQGSIQYKVYPKEKTKEVTEATSKLNFTTAMGTITHVTLQWKSASKGSIKVKRIWLVKRDGTKEPCDPSVYWGCYMSDVNTSNATEGQEGDANGDGEVNVADVDYVIERIGEALDTTNKAADVNGDGDINVADVDYIIERIK